MPRNIPLSSSPHVKCSHELLIGSRRSKFTKGHNYAYCSYWLFEEKEFHYTFYFSIPTSANKNKQRKAEGATIRIISFFISARHIILNILIAMIASPHRWQRIFIHFSYICFFILYIDYWYFWWFEPHSGRAGSSPASHITLPGQPAYAYQKDTRNHLCYMA